MCIVLSIVGIQFLYLLREILHTYVTSYMN